MNSRQKGKVGEREFAALLRVHGFDARRGQQFAGGVDSPDVVSDALAWLHIEVKRVQNLNLAEACAQARRDCGGKSWIVAHRQNRGPWFVTMDSDALYDLLHTALTYFDLWPFVGPRPITMDAELFFQFLRVASTKGHRGNGGPTPHPTTDFGKSSGASPAVARETCAFPETEQTKQTEH